MRPDGRSTWHPWQSSMRKLEATILEALWQLTQSAIFGSVMVARLVLLAISWWQVWAVQMVALSVLEMVGVRKLYAVVLAGNKVRGQFAMSRCGTGIFISSGLWHPRQSAVVDLSLSRGFIPALEWQLAQTAWLPKNAYAPLSGK